MSHAAVVDAFDELARAPRATQARTLAGLIEAARPSRFGQAHGFDRLRDADDYRARVPLCTYEDLRPWLEQDAGALTGERPLALLTTSASTGKPKAIPYTAGFRDSIRAAHDVFSAACFRDFPDLPLGRGQAPRAMGLYQVSAQAPGRGDVPLDSYVSRLFDVALPEDPFFFALPRQVYTVPDARRRLYIMMLLGADWDLRALRATNPTTLLLFARILAESTEALLADLAAPERAEFDPAVRALARPRPDLARKLARLDRPLCPRDLWPRLELLVTWRGGACQLYEPFLHEQFGPVRIRAPIFAASEGVVAIPLADDMAGGVPALASSFFEFRPLEDSGMRTLLVDELEPGARYELVLTSPAGMYRYLIGDIVEVEGRYQACPTIRFVARKGRTSSLTGEKLTELQVEDAVGRASARVGHAPMFWLLSPALAARPSYVLCVDWGAHAAEPEIGAQLALSVDQELARLNVEYRAKRESDRLGPVALVETMPGEFERLQAGGLSGARAVNFKLPHLAAEPVHERMRALVR
jgi:hypothetical protein